MIPLPVTRGVDLSLPMSIIPHDYCGPSSQFAKVPGVGIEIISLNIEWIGGMGMGNTKVAPSVHHQFVNVVVEGNNMGPLIPQISMVMGPDNVLSAIHLLTGSCDVIFSAGDVQAEGTPIALVFPLTPMKVCADPVSVPFGYSITNVLNTAVVIPHIMDLIAGVATIWAGLVVDAFKGSLSGPGDSLGNNFSSAFTNALFEAVVGDVPDGRKMIADQVPGLVTALVRATGRLVFDDYQAPVAVGVSVSQGMIIGGGLEYQWGSDGSHQVSQNGRLAGGLFRESASTTWGSDGSTTHQTSITTLGGHGTSNTDTVQTDRQGNVTQHTRDRNRNTGRDRSIDRSMNTDGSWSETRVVRQNGREVSRTTRSGVREI